MGHVINSPANDNQAPGVGSSTVRQLFKGSRKGHPMRYHIHMPAYTAPDRKPVEAFVYRSLAYMAVETSFAVMVAGMLGRTYHGGIVAGDGFVVSLMVAVALLLAAFETKRTAG